MARPGRHRVLLSLAVAVLSAALPAIAPPAGAQSPPGTDFWFAPPIFSFLEPERGDYLSYVDLVADAPANVTISGAEIWNGRVLPGRPQSVLLRSCPKLSEDRVVTNKGIHIVSDSPVSASWRAPSGYYDEAALLVPTDCLGTDYYALTYRWEVQNYGAGFMIVATADATRVDWIDVCDFGSPTVTVRLDRGQSYMALCLGDISGAHIMSDKPISVMAFTHGEFVPYAPEPLGCCADPMVETLLPVSAWGTVHHAPRLPRGPDAAGMNDFLLVAAARDGTTLELTGPADSISDTLDAGASAMYDIEGPVRVVSSEPVSVMLTYKSWYRTNMGDPYTMLVTPERARWPAYRFFTADGDNPWWEYLVTVIAEDGPSAGVTLDGLPVAGVWRDVPGSTHKQLDIPVSVGEHLLEAGRPVAAYVHSYALHESIGQPASPSTVVPTCVATASAPPLDLCPGDTPLLDGTGSLIVRCDGHAEYRWSEEGFPLGPFSPDPTYIADPPVGETVYTLEVRCSTDPACADSVDFLVTRLPPGPLPDVGNDLRVEKAPSSPNRVVFLDWTRFPPPGRPGEHYHVYRSLSPTGPFEMRGVDPSLVARRYFDPAAGALLFYEVRIADRCETMSGDAFPHTLPSDCFEPSLACNHSVTTALEPTCPAEISQHDCLAGSLAGPERRHRLDLASAARVRLELLASDPTLRLLVYDRDLTTCLAGGGPVLQTDLPPGPYTILVDSPLGASGPYSLQVHCL